jgi:hypothetical protein
VGIVGAAVGAIAFIPTGYEYRDGPPGCGSCGTFNTTVLAGIHRVDSFPRVIVQGAVAGFILGLIFATLVFWVQRRHDRRLAARA